MASFTEINSPSPSETAPLVTIADLLERLDGIPPERIRLHPEPGKATEKDVIEIERRENRLCELIDGVLVEKPMGFYESSVASAIIYLIEAFLSNKNLGIVAGEGGTLRFSPRLIYIPDVSFVSWDRLPDRVLPTKPIPELIPDLAIEVLSKGNTKKEMARKLRDYFATGVRLVWYVDPRTRTIEVYRSPTDHSNLSENDILTGGEVLPGFEAKIANIFARAEGRRDE
jgi:Uma2 family endonuclease